MSFTKVDVANKIVRLSTAAPGELGLFICSSIDIGQSMAGTFLDDGEGAVVPLSSMFEIVDPKTAANQLDRWNAAKDKARIEEVVKSVDDAQEEFSGTIILHVSFEGSLAKSKALTPAERKLLLSVGGQEAFIRKKMKEAKILFQSDEYDALESFRSKRRSEFANLGIPFPLGASMYLIRIANIPKAEALAARTNAELKTFVEALCKVYPKQITKDATGLDILYNAGDYKSAEALPGLFKFRTKWMHFGVPDVLKEIDEAMWNRERERTASVWAEAKEQGLLLLRQSVAEMVSRLVDTMKPGEGDKEKKRFYATSVTNLTDFFEAFEDRNLAGDSALAEQVQKLKALVEGKDIKSFRDDDALRATVAREGAKISETLQAMLVDASVRSITFED